MNTEAANPLVDRLEHVRRITAAWQKTVANIVETGRLLIEAKDDIGHGGFQVMIRAELPFGPSTAQRLMQIAEDPVLSNAAHAPLLPASWMTLYELAKLPKHGVDLGVLIEERAIHPKMERRDVLALLPAPDGQRDDDLEEDYEGSVDPEAETGGASPPAGDEEEDSQAQVIEPDHQDESLAEKLRAAEFKILGLKSEVAELRAENADLRQQLERMTAPKKRGRPKGSTNKPKPPVMPDTSDEIVESVPGNDPGPFPESMRRVA
jgi:hypothetical protein